MIQAHFSHSHLGSTPIIRSKHFKPKSSKLFGFFFFFFTFCLNLWRTALCQILLIAILCCLKTALCRSKTHRNGNENGNKPGEAAARLPLLCLASDRLQRLLDRPAGALVRALHHLLQLVRRVAAVGPPALHAPAVPVAHAVAVAAAVAAAALQLCPGPGST